MDWLGCDAGRGRMVDVVDSEERLIGVIRGIFSNELEVRVSHEVVTVNWDGQSKSIRAVFQVSAGAGRPRVIGVGECQSAEPSTVVPLFGPLPAGISSDTWEEGLNAFMQHLLSQALLGLVAIRPVVHLRGVRALGGLPIGEPGQMLVTALLRANAFHCTVED